MDFYPENIHLEIISLLNASSPPGVSLTGLEETDFSPRDLNFTWWLEYFLRAGPAVFQEKFDSLPNRNKAIWPPGSGAVSSTSP